MIVLVGLLTAFLRLLVRLIHESMPIMAALSSGALPVLVGEVMMSLVTVLGRNSRCVIGIEDVRKPIILFLAVLLRPQLLVRRLRPQLPVL
jgi:hypothetical protein